MDGPLKVKNFSQSIQLSKWFAFVVVGCIFLLLLFPLETYKARINILSVESAEGSFKLNNPSGGKNS